MSAINFVVRGDAGVTERGAVAGASGSNSIIVGQGQDISLNIQRGSILSYTRQGQALQITLVDGQVITIEGFFSPDGTAENQLFISASGQLAEVELLNADGNLLLAQYVDADSFGKWSPDDALYFTDDGAIQIAGVEDAADVGMLGVPLLGGLGGLGGAGLAAAGVAAAVAAGGVSSEGEDEGGGENPDPDDPDEPEEPTDPKDPKDPTDPEEGDAPEVAITEGVKSVNHTVNDEDHSDGVDISGTGTPNTSGTITVGDVTRDITVDGDGNWTVQFNQSEVPGGEYEIDVIVELTNEYGSTTTSDVLVVDTVAMVTFDASTVEGDGVVNFVEESDGVVLTGTTQAGSSVEVAFGGNTYQATVEGGTWTLNVGAGVFAQGEYDVDISVTATDQFGNTASTSDTLHIDTITDVTIDTSQAGGDGVVNAVEHNGGVYVTGTAEANASVVVTMGSYSHTVQADANGNYNVTFAANETPTGTLDMDVTAVSTDAAGNTATATDSVHIDTELDVTIDTSGITADGIINAEERDGLIAMRGTSEPNADIVVEFEGMTRTTTTNANGQWAVNFDGSGVRGGDLEMGVPAKVTATDAAGNVAVDTGTVMLDTYVNRLEHTGPIEGDNVVNNAEAADGITLTGVVEQGSTVFVTVSGGGKTTTHEATVNANGTWTVDFAAGDIAHGEYQAQVTIDATDAAGNTAQIEDTFTVDTVAPDAPNVESFTEGEGSGDANSTRGIGIENNTNDVSLFEYANGASSTDALSADNGTFVNPGTGELNFFFDDGHEVPNGSHIIVSDTDGAGNTNSTLMVLDEEGNNTLDIPTGALTDHNIGAIDLVFAEDTELTLTPADLEAMSANDNILVIHGGSDDAVTFTGDTTLTGTTTIDGRDYNVYDAGGDAQLIVDQDIRFNEQNNVI